MQGESSKAFAAFCVYRDLGPQRSLRKASEAAAEPDEDGKKAVKRFRMYGVWSGLLRWVECAAAWTGSGPPAVASRRWRKSRRPPSATPRRRWPSSRRGWNGSKRGPGRPVRAVRRAADAQMGIELGNGYRPLEPETRKDKTPPPDDAVEELPSDAVGGATLTGFLNAARARRDAGSCRPAGAGRFRAGRPVGVPARMNAAEVQDLIRWMTPEERLEAARILASVLFVPNPGPQLAALNSPAYELFYGGSAGGGKSFLLLGLACTQHRKSLLLRREATQLLELIQQWHELLAGKGKYNGSSRIWTIPTRDGSGPDDRVERLQGRTEQTAVQGAVT